MISNKKKQRESESLLGSVIKCSIPKPNRCYTVSDTGELSYAETLKLLDLLKQQIDQENSDLFIPYIGALESLQESIDLEQLATFGIRRK